MRIYITDMRKEGYCSAGIRVFFKKYDLDYSAFLREGIDADELKTTNDSLAFSLIKKCENRDRLCLTTKNSEYL